MQLDETQARWLKRIGYPILALFTFVMGVHCTFPYERVKTKVVSALSGGYDVSIDELGPGWWPGRYRVEGITLTSRPTKEGEKVRRLFVDRVDVNVGLLALIAKKVDLDIDAQLGEGTITGHVVQSKDGISLELDTHDLPLESVPGLDGIIGGAPLRGGLAAHVSLRLPGKKLADAEGTVTLACSACVLGDGVSKIKPTSTGGANAFNKDGFTLPRIKIGKIDGRVVIGRGAICIDRFQTQSAHGELVLAGGIQLSEPFSQSQTQLYARFKLSDAFKAESERNRDFDILMASAARGPDGYSTYSARTSLATLKWLIAKRAMEPLKECAGIGTPIQVPDRSKPPDVAASTPPLGNGIATPPPPSEPTPPSAPAAAEPDAAPPPLAEPPRAEPPAEPPPPPPPEPTPQPQPAHPADPNAPSQ